ncbi:SH3 domain-containing protein [Maribacter sp.]|uniref:SH3 domain-containing protein n=1 Tax=Maribacter sp. TaxID=1897614 RepID=UPI0032999FD1
MKIFILLIMTIFSFNIYGQEYYFINAESGLNVRSESSLSSKKIAKIPFGTLIEKISDTDKYLTINDNGKEIKGQFIKIKYNNYGYLVNKEIEQFEKEGYVFDAYLKKQDNKEIIHSLEINKIEYFKLLKNVDKTIYRPIKIENLDSIKSILKNRIEWVTEFSEDEYEREDAIKSIFTDNGQKLRISQIGNDYGFSEGHSGYYPEYDILLLEGGHSSDMCFSIKTGETDLTIGNPEYIIPSPKNTYRLNGSFGGQECISYFFQKRDNEKFIYLTKFGWDYDICEFEEFYWINENEFIYRKKYHKEEYFRGKIKNNT